MKEKQSVNANDIEFKRTILSFSLASFLNDVGGDIVEPFWPTFVTEVLGAPLTFLGLLDGLGEAIATFIKLPAGHLSDRIGKRKSFIWLGYLMPALARVGYAVSTSATSLLSLKIIDRSGKLRDPPRDAMLAEKTKRKDRGKTFGFLGAADMLGATLGPVLALILFALSGYRLLFLMASIPSVIGALLVIILVKEGKRKFREKGKFTLKIGDDLRRFLIVSIPFALSSFSISFMIRYANQVGLSLLSLPVVYLIYTFTASLVSVPGGKLSDRIGRKTTLILSYLLYSFAMLGFATIIWPIAIFLLFSLLGLHHGILKATQKAFLSDLSLPDTRGTTFGIFQTGFALCVSAASIIAGVLWDLVGPTATFYYGLTLSLLGAILLKMFVKKN